MELLAFIASFETKKKMANDASDDVDGVEVVGDGKIQYEEIY